MGRCRAASLACCLAAQTACSGAGRGTLAGLHSGGALAISGLLSSSLTSRFVSFTSLSVRPQQCPVDALLLTELDASEAEHLGA